MAAFGHSVAEILWQQIRSHCLWLWSQLICAFDERTTFFASTDSTVLRVCIDAFTICFKRLPSKLANKCIIIFFLHRFVYSPDYLEVRFCAFCCRIAHRKRIVLDFVVFFYISPRIQCRRKQEKPRRFLCRVYWNKRFRWHPVSLCVRYTGLVRVKKSICGLCATLNVTICFAVKVYCPAHYSS